MKGDQPKRPRGARGKKKGKTEDLPPAPLDAPEGASTPEATEGSDAPSRPELLDAESASVHADADEPGAALEEAVPSEDAAAPEEIAAPGEAAAPADATPEEGAGDDHPVTSVPPPPESSEQVSAGTTPPAKGKRGKKAAAPKQPKGKGKRGKGKDEAAPPESSKKLVGEALTDEHDESDRSEDTWHGSDPEATVNLRGELADLFPLRDDDVVLTEVDEAPSAEADAEDDPVVSDDDGEALDDEGGEASAPESAETKVADPSTTARDHLRGVIEALVFASDKPLSVRDLSRAAEAPSKDVKALLDELRVFYKPRGIQLDEVAGGFVFRTNALFAPFVRDLTKQKPVKLTRAQLETLAILAYRQPITRPEIDDIRGVDSGPVLKMLLERDLVRILGKKDEPGRPLLYGSTPEFLEFFGLKSLKDLPTLQEFTELNEDSKRVAEKELGESFDDIQTLLDHGDEEAAPATDGAVEGHDTEIPPAATDAGAEDDWGDAGPLDGADGVDEAEAEAADTDAPSAPDSEHDIDAAPEANTEIRETIADDDFDAPETAPTEAPSDEDDAPVVSEEDPNLDEAPSEKPSAGEPSSDEDDEDDYDDDDFEDDDDDDDEDEEDDDDE